MTRGTWLWGRSQGTRHRTTWSCHLRSRSWRVHPSSPVHAHGPIALALQEAARERAESVGIDSRGRRAERRRCDFSTSALFATCGRRLILNADGGKRFAFRENILAADYLAYVDH